MHLKYYSIIKLQVYAFVFCPLLETDLGATVIQKVSLSWCRRGSVNYSVCVYNSVRGNEMDGLHSRDNSGRMTLI